MREISLDSLWEEISSIGKIEERRIKIFDDLRSSNFKFKGLAEEDPYRLFQLLGGDENKIETNNWAFEYEYEDYVDEYGVEFDENEFKEWKLEERSIQRAHDSGFWYVTGISNIRLQNGDELPFEFQYTEGYLDGIIGTPYNKSQHGNHGLLF